MCANNFEKNWIITPYYPLHPLHQSLLNLHTHKFYKKNSLCTCWNAKLYTGTHDTLHIQIICTELHAIRIHYIYIPVINIYVYMYILWTVWMPLYLFRLCLLVDIFSTNIDKFEVWILMDVTANFQFDPQKQNRDINDFVADHIIIILILLLRSLPWSFLMMCFGYFLNLIGIHVIENECDCVFWYNLSWTMIHFWPNLDQIIFIWGLLVYFHKLEL